eukprot:3142745-Rhodomonas_salina.1
MSQLRRCFQPPKLRQLLWAQTVAFAVAQLLSVVCSAGPPNCHCAIPAQQWPVRMGKNKGKIFYTCQSRSCEFKFWHGEGFSQASQPQSTPSTSLLRKRQDPEPQHKLVAYSSKEPLGSLSVHVVQIQPKILLKEDEITRFLRILTAKTFHALPFRDLEMTLRKPSSSVAAEAVFLEKPSDEVLAEFASIHEDFPCSALLSGTDTITAADWEPYKAILMKTFRKQYPKLRYERSEWRVPISSDRVTVSYPGFERAAPEYCNVTRCVKVSLTTTRSENESGAPQLLLVSFQIVHTFDSTQNVESMLARGTIEKTIGSQPGCEVRAVGDGARFAGDLCEPEDNSTISQNRTSLGGRSLLVYNRQYRVRSELLKSANPATLAVGMRKRDGTVLDYPPQLLEPVWKLANLRSGSLSGSGMQHKCSPTKWLRHIKEVARQVRETVQFPNITLCEEMFDPEFLDAKIPNFKAGPIAEAVKIQPLYPQTIPTAEILDVFKSLKTERERDRRMKTAKWEWLDPMTYDPRASPAKIRTELESKLADVPRGAL